MRTRERTTDARLREQLERWRGVGLIDTATEEAIEAFEATRVTPDGGRAVRTERRIPLVAEAIGYLGTALAAAAVLTLLIDVWNTWSDVARAVVIGAVTVAALGGGWLLRRATEPAIGRLSTFLLGIGTGGVALTTVFTLDEVVNMADDMIAAQIAGGVALAVAIPLYLTTRRGLQQVAVLGAASMLIMPSFDQSDWFGVVMMSIGLTWFALGYFGVIQPSRLARVVGAVLALMGTTAGPALEGVVRDALLVGGMVLAIGAVAISIPLRQFELTALGSLFLFQHLMIWVNENFAGTLGVPIALLVAGAIAFGAAMLLVRRSRR